MTHIKHRKVIGKHVYRLRVGCLTKASAERKAKAHRKIGHKARVFRHSCGYSLYVSE